tara:strand:- start:263 stop:1042 length:780 start_codon:yes stop_codon:yes gene_type:complete
MRITITENQYTRLFEQEEISCAPTGDTEYKEVDVTIYDIMNGGKILYYGDKDLNDMGAIKRIQVKLGINDDGYYGPTMVETIANKLGIDLCNDKWTDYSVGSKTLPKLGLFDTTIPNEDTEDYVNYILASTLVGECNRCRKDELFAIYSTIKHRSKGSMVDAVLKPKQYSTWNSYNKSDDKKLFLQLRIAEQKRKGFDEMLSLVKGFRNKSPLKYNHYVNPTIVDLENSKRSIAKSYRDSKESSKQIGKHLFWWDKKHK